MLASETEGVAGFAGMIINRRAESRGTWQDPAGVEPEVIKA